jgi:hypothetical protein
MSVWWRRTPPTRYAAPAIPSRLTCRSRASLHRHHRRWGAERPSRPERCRIYVIRRRTSHGIDRCEPWPGGGSERALPAPAGASNTRRCRWDRSDRQGGGATPAPTECARWKQDAVDGIDSTRGRVERPWSGVDGRLSTPPIDEPIGRAESPSAACRSLSLPLGGTAAS